MKIIAIVHETPEILAGVFFKVFKGFKGDTLRLALILPPPIHIFNQKEKIKQGAFRSPKLKVFKTPFQKKNYFFRFPFYCDINRCLVDYDEIYGIQEEQKWITLTLVFIFMRDLCYFVLEFFFIKPLRVELCAIRPFIKVGKYS